MNTQLANARNTESGFTLIELLVVILIIGILTAIAVPAFLNQRKKANDTAVKSDMKTVVTQIETGLVDNPNAVGAAIKVDASDDVDANNAVTVEVGSSTQDVELSDGVTITGAGDTDNPGAYTVTGSHENGDKSGLDDQGEGGITYDSAAGGF